VTGSGDRVTDAEWCLDRLDRLCRARGFDWGARADIAMDCAWAAEVRVTPDPNHRGRPDRSVVTYSAGGATAETAVRRAAAEMLTWLEQLDRDTVPTLGLTGQRPAGSQHRNRTGVSRGRAPRGGTAAGRG
jgi:hypothetical protein